MVAGASAISMALFFSMTHPVSPAGMARWMACSQRDAHFPKLAPRPAPSRLVTSPDRRAKPPAAMLLFPAIDLKDGKCVRLLRGDMARATVFNDSPAAQAKAFANAGCEWLHLVDLNGAVEGHPVNRAAVESILADVNVPAQLGGGIRTIESISQWIDAGVKRVILGTIAVKEPGLVKAACRQWPGQVAVGIDARDGIVSVDGWARQSTVLALDLTLRF